MTDSLDRLRAALGDRHTVKRELLNVLHAPLFDGIRAAPRFQRLLARVGLQRDHQPRP